jgi:multicomponent Na+:H+ antiporter subunit A
VSAYLHSATMVKAGIYLLARLHPALGGTPEWIWTLTIAGAATAVWASIVALSQTDLKLALAHTTVMALGTLTLFLAGTSTVAIAAAMTFLIVHALYKCGLFLVVGILDHETGTRDADRLGGLARAMPITALAAALAAFSMAGFPPFLGFIGKELKYEGALAIASEPWLAAAASVTANALMVAIAGIVALRPFYGPRLPTPRPAHDPPIRMWLGPLTLAAIGLAFGLVPPVAGKLLVEPAAAAVLGAPVVIKLKLWHGINLPLMLSLVTFAAGLLLYRWHRPLRAGLGRAFQRLPITADRSYDRVVDATLAAARAQTRLLQSGSLRRYLLIVFAATALAVGGTLVAQDEFGWPAARPAISYAEWGIVLLIAVGAVLPVATRARLTAICGLGVVGAGIALIFLLYGAPDVAMTQLLVEILFVVLIAIILLKFPDVVGPGHPGRGAPIRDGIVAGLTGATVTLLMLAVLDVSISRHVADFFEASSVPLGHGRNIVNVILVDFRALDTLGEIVVVAVAAIGAYAVIKLKAPPARDSEERR